MQDKSLQSKRSTVKRVPKRGHYDLKTIQEILQAAYLAQIGFQYEGQSYVIPTLYGQQDQTLYLHGATSSRMLKAIAGQSICVSVTLVDGFVLARSAFHHSMNYRSVVLFGNAELVEDETERLAGLKAISDQMLPGRWEEVRAPNSKELKATSVLKLDITEGAAKIRTGAPKDEPSDYNLPIWAGVLPIEQTILAPIPDPALNSTVILSPSLKQFKRKSSS